MKGRASKESRLHIEGRSPSHTSAQISPSRVAQFQYTPDPTPSSTPLQTVRIQQATISTVQQFTISSDPVSTSSSPTMLTTASGPAASPGPKHALSPGSIAGLAMVPVGVILIAVAVFTYFWLRKRRRSRPIVHHSSFSPPPVPEKELRSPASSFDSTASGGKVRSMSAIVTPIVHTGWHASPRPQANNDAAFHHNPWHDELPSISADINTVDYATKRTVEDGSDSPIDRSSPFRLKRGDTKRNRSSLDPGFMSAWPVPPRPVQAAVVEPLRTGKPYLKRRSISAEYFAQEGASRNVRGAQHYWEEINLELGPGPGPILKS